MFNVDWLGLSIPFAYIAVLVGSLVTFSSVYRKRKAAAAASLSSLFPDHTQRDIYLSLLHLEPEGENKPTQVPDSLKSAALLRRAVEDIHRVTQIRNSKQACISLLKRGSIGDDLLQTFLCADKEMENELNDVVMEANGLHPNWGQTIFQSANEIAANLAIRDSLDEIQAEILSEKKWWDKRREQIQTEFLKELDAKPSTPSRAVNASNDNDTPVSNEGVSASSKGSSKTKKTKK
ncbi:Translocation protein sec66 [Golovinomyces cichoracearum]|uniref:Translocation protein sec66 n=1 Tax=Golovinomyces cichoracearum TaxID=62708 RepID=A0A420I761_9PEZI|nr:Translocation protein sec66 [Golovinomyces cichoracearum]